MRDLRVKMKTGDAARVGLLLDIALQLGVATTRHRHHVSLLGHMMQRWN
jgi:hypothetical protein